MAFLDLGSDAENTAGKTALGVKGLRQATTLSPEVRIVLPGQEGTDAAAWAIGVALPFGEHRQQRVPEVNGGDGARLFSDIRSAQWLAHYVANGVEDGTLYNLGEGANNISQQQTYQILQVSGNRMQLKGRHPGRVVHGNSTINPEWPGLDGNGDPLHAEEKKAGLA
jgi:hypothetical protein